MQGRRLKLLTKTLLILGIALLWLGGSCNAASDEQLPAGLTALRETLPDFTAPGVNGTTVRSADLQGKVMILRFWASW